MPIHKIALLHLVQWIRHLNHIYYVTFLSVAQPNVTIEGSRNGSVFAGTTFALIIDIFFTKSFFISEGTLIYETRWKKQIFGTDQSNEIFSDDRITVSTVLGKPSLTYSPIATSDSGLITATVTVSSLDSSMLIQPVTATSLFELNITGMLLH